MNAQHQKYASKGLVVLGISDEGRDKLAGWIEKRGATYPVVSSRRGSDQYGVRGYPTYILVGADGKVIAGPQHRKFSDAQIEAALKYVELFPELPKSSKFDALRKASKKQNVVDASRALTRLEQDGALSAAEKRAVAQIRKDFNTLVQSTLEEIKTLGNGPDYLTAQNRLKDIVKRFKGMPIEADAKAQLANFSRDKQIKKEIKAAKELAALTKKYGKSRRRSDRKIYAKHLETLVKRRSGTRAAEQAEQLLNRL